VISDEAFNVQLGCHLEEVVEMMDALAFHSATAMVTLGQNTTLRNWLNIMANALKLGQCSATIIDREGFLDAVADQIVTGIGTAVCADMKPSDALALVDGSNWSKFVDGQPQFNEAGKIAKGVNYKKPDLAGLY